MAAAEALQDREFLANVVMFHSQQAAEKALKAILEHRGAVVPRTHSIRTLARRILDTVPGAQRPDEPDMELLDEVYIDSRYPGSLGMLPGGTPTMADASRAIDAAHRVVALARATLAELH